MGSERKKLLLLGAKGFERDKEGLRVDCFEWAKIGKIQNIRDYDVLVLNVLSLTEEARKEIDWERFQLLLSFPAAADILRDGGRIVVVGDPRFNIPQSQIPPSVRPFLFWTGLDFQWDNQPGDTVTFKTDFDAYKDYRRRLKKWEYSLGGISANKVALKEIWNLEIIKANDCFPEIEVCEPVVNRYGHALMFHVWHQVKDRYSGVRLSCGPFYFLPGIGADEDETLQLVLRDFCDAAAELPEPDWLSAFWAPGQKAVDDKISEIKTAINERTVALQKAVQERSMVRSCLKLLYEREFGLEPIVRQTLNELGAEVEEPTEKNKEDGWLKVKVGDDVHEGVIEVKSTRSDQFGEDGRKQLLDWIDRGRTLRNKNYKGIFIGNSAVTKPIKDRPDAFSDSWKKNAALSHICAMKSEDLYYIYILHKQGRIDLADFWTRLFKTDGVFDINPFLPKEPKKD